MTDFQPIEQATEAERHLGNSMPAAAGLPSIVREPGTPALPADDIEAAASFARQEKAPATRAAYRSRLRLLPRLV